MFVLMFDAFDVDFACVAFCDAPFALFLPCLMLSVAADFLFVNINFDSPGVLVKQT